MFEVAEVSSIARVIQLAVAPVFLLSGIGAMLAVMTNRAGRIIDRARALEIALQNAEPDEAESIRTRLRTLAERAKLIGLAIALCTTTAVLVCTIIAILFLSAFVKFNATVPVAALFILAMMSLIVGLIWLLREIFVATANLRIGPY